MHIAARIAAGMLSAGFLYSGAATLRLYRQEFRKPAIAGPSSSIDFFLSPVRLPSAAHLRTAVENAGWPTDAEIVLFSVDPSLSRQDLYQTYYSASYVLHPRRVWLAADESDIEKHGARHLILVGERQPFPGAHSQRLTPVLNMVKLR